ncbi:cysteine-rich repeat secretory protein 38-like [Bidens hawaiensis]|uniref:cysteine-rich repeat secretory protein 38-like n=1 Tax=Bidens hawaiensis TaxID=980011 RepID=UPI00404A4E77
MAAHKKLPGSNYASVGDKPDQKVIVLALCAGYLKLNDCASCVNSTIPLLLQKCPNQKVAVAWRVKCMVRYGMPVINDYDVWFVAHEASAVKVKDVALLEKNRPSLERMLLLEVERKTQQPYAYNALAYGSQTLHMVMQCTPDISPSLCKECLVKASGEIKSCCSGATAAAVLTPNCYMRYAHTDFRI